MIKGVRRAVLFACVVGAGAVLKILVSERAVDKRWPEGSLRGGY